MGVIVFFSAEEKFFWGVCVFLSIKMATTQGRSLVSVHNVDGKQVRRIHLPAVFNAPVRQDLVNRMHTEVRKNHRQPYCVNRDAGHQTSAESWGTGRAVARIPRVRGGGTHRSGQGAFGNMCRGGHMFGSKKVWRRIHRKVSVRQKRYAICSAIAASGSPAIVMSKGHQIMRTREVPLVVDNRIESFKKTKEAVAFLKRHQAWPDVVRVYKSKRNRAGKGKLRNRRKIQRKGPLVVVHKNEGASLAFRNIPGVEVVNVDRLNLLKVAPGGHVGRFIIWSEGAFMKLGQVYGTYHHKSEMKKNFNLPQPIMTSSDLTAIMKHENIKKALKPPRLHRILSDVKLNPLVNKKKLNQLNPYAKVESAVARKVMEKALVKKSEKQERLAMRAKLAVRKELSAAANATIKKKAAQAKQLARVEKSKAALKAFLDKKNRSAMKDADDKTIMTKAEKKAFREKKAAEFKKAFEELRKSKTQKKTKKAATKTVEKPIAKSAEDKQVQKMAFKARKAEKVALATAQLRNALFRLPEVVSARRQAGKEAKAVKNAEAVKAGRKIVKYRKSVKETPALRKAKKYDGKKPKFAAKAKAKNVAATEQRLNERRALEKLAGMKFIRKE